MICSVCLLAGFSTRMGQPKQHVKFGEKSFLEIVTDKLTQLSSSYNKMIFVGQQNDTRAIEIVKKMSGIWLSNPTPEKGPLSSIRIALREVSKDSAIMLWPIDHPLSGKDVIEQLLQIHIQKKDKIIVPSNGERRGHPTIFPAWCYDEFYNIPLDKGAKIILQRYPEKIEYLLTQDKWILRNINTPQELEDALKEYKA